MFWGPVLKLLYTGSVRFGLEGFRSGVQGLGVIESLGQRLVRIKNYRAHT